MYPYLVSSLPFLEFGAKAPVSYKSFLDDCERLLPAKDFILVRAAAFLPVITHQGKNSLLDKWNQFKNSLHNEFVVFRATAQGKEFNSHLHYEKWSEPFLGQVVSEADKAEDPLSAQTIIDRAVWQYLDELLGNHYFDLEFLIIYGLKLQMLEKYQRIASVQGQEILNNFRQEALDIGQRTG